MRHERAFSLTELMIVMLLSLILLSIALTTFASLNRSSRQTQQLAELQQSAQFMLSLMRNELQNMAFWGGQNDISLAKSVENPLPPTPDCVNADIDSGSFPQAAASFVYVYARLVSFGRQLNCIPSAAAGSELLQLKRLIGHVQTVDTLRDNRFYLESDWQHSRFVSADSADLQPQMQYFPYQHLVLYVQMQRLDGQNIPVLMRKRLVRNAAGVANISTDSIIDGVERLHFEFGVDSNLDGTPDFQLTTAEISDDIWQQQTARIVSLKYYVLLRARAQDEEYINDQTYTMGKQLFKADGDHYRRLLVSSTVFFNNAVL